MSLQIYNTISRRIEEFKPINPPEVLMYTCGFTVYDYAHIGHMRKYTNDDVLRRVLIQNGFRVKHVQNVTDVGHLVSDQDEGEDKLEKGARKLGKDVWEVARYFEEHFYTSLAEMNILKPDIICRATEHIREQIGLIKSLEDKGYTYTTDLAVYFDISKFTPYGNLSGQKLEDKKSVSRDDLVSDPDKKNAADFALWVKRVGTHSNHQMHWDSPWGDGFPGWHIECSAMAIAYLGPHFDIHTGGIDHIPVHHENEIAQSEAATGQPFVNYWVHHNFLTVDGVKMSKSLENFYTLEDLKEKGFDPLALRLLIFSTHYRQIMNFTWEALESSSASLEKIRRLVFEKKKRLGEGVTMDKTSHFENFMAAVNEDLNMPKALAVVWEALKDNTCSYEEIMKMDQILGLKLDSIDAKKIPEEILELAKKRDALRRDKNFAESDRIREEIEKLGYEVSDSPNGTIVS